MSSAVPSILSGWVRYQFRPGVKAYNFGQFGRIVDGLNGKPARPVVRLVKRAMPRVPVEIPVDRAAARPTTSSTARIDRRAKLQRYARHGIPHYWIVDPEARSIEAYVLSEGVFRVSVRVDGADPGSLPHSQT
jgi:Putative restriction endonuclease